MNSTEYPRTWAERLLFCQCTEQEFSEAVIIDSCVYSEPYFEVYAIRSGGVTVNYLRSFSKYGGIAGWTLIGDRDAYNEWKRESNAGQRDPYTGRVSA